MTNQTSTQDRLVGATNDNIRFTSVDRLLDGKLEWHVSDASNTPPTNGGVSGEIYVFLKFQGAEI